VPVAWPTPKILTNFPFGGCSMLCIRVTTCGVPSALPFDLYLTLSHLRVPI
jgi:hypothetical protein